MADRSLPDLILYGRADCSLCDETRDLLHALLEDRKRRGLPSPALIERDIDSDPSWQRAFFASIPVVELGERRIEMANSLAALRRLFAEVLDAQPTTA